MRRLAFCLLTVLPPTTLLAWSGPSHGASDAGTPLPSSLARRDGAADGAGAHAHDGDVLPDARVRRDSGPISRIPPDPVPLEEIKQVVVDLRWERGEVFLTAVRALDLEAPRVTPRVMGRFALELFEGRTLIERVRFDFPGLVDGDFADAGHTDPPRIDRKLTTRVGVMFPRTSRGTRFELWDRATDRRWQLPWNAP